jgi:hypothetical protein
MIAVYHSPNKGGNKHANINDFTYDDMDDIPLKTDEEKQRFKWQSYRFNNCRRNYCDRWSSWLSSSESKKQEKEVLEMMTKFKSLFDLLNSSPTEQDCIDYFKERR